MTDETQNEAGLAEIAGEASETASTALALNSQETLKELQKEVHEEFVTSDREVYKEGLRSLTIQEQKLRKQIAEIEREIAQVHEAKQAL